MLTRRGRGPAVPAPRSPPLRALPSSGGPVSGRYGPGRGGGSARLCESRRSSTPLPRALGRPEQSREGGSTTGARRLRGIAEGALEAGGAAALLGQYRCQPRGSCRVWKSRGSRGRRQPARAGLLWQRILLAPSAAPASLPRVRVRPAAGQCSEGRAETKDGNIHVLPWHLVAMKGIQLSQIHPKDERQETASLVSTAKLGS